MIDRINRTIRVPTTRQSATRAILASFGFLHYVDFGDRLSLQDGERCMDIEIVLAGDPRLGNVDESANRLQFSFIGYSESEADELIQQYLFSTLERSHVIDSPVLGDI